MSLSKIKVIKVIRTMVVKKQSNEKIFLLIICWIKSE